MGNQSSEGTQIKCVGAIALSGSASAPAASKPLRYILSTDREVVIGRDLGCQIAIDSNRYPGVSRHHAKIRPLATKLQPAWQICDLNAANGTFVNGQQLSPGESQLLRTGDRITLGQDGPEMIFEFQTVSVAAPSSVQPVESPSPEVKQSIPSTIEQKLEPKTKPSVTLTSSTIASNQSSAAVVATQKSLWNISTSEEFRTLKLCDKLVYNGKLLSKIPT